MSIAGDMSLTAQIAWSAAAGILVVALSLLIRRGRPSGWADVTWSVGLFAYVCTFAFELLHDTGQAREGQMIRLGVMLVVSIALMALFVRDLIANWRDEEKLGELVGSQQGYIARPERLTPRTKALLYPVLLGVLLVATSFFYLKSLFSPE